MSNIKLHYLYRDGSNYKKWADIVFLNPDDLPAEIVTEGLREAFLEDGIFIAHQVRIPEVFLPLTTSLRSMTTASTSSRRSRPLRIRQRPVQALDPRVHGGGCQRAKRGWCAFDPRTGLLQRSR